MRKKKENIVIRIRIRIKVLGNHLRDFTRLRILRDTKPVLVLPTKVFALQVSEDLVDFSKVSDSRGRGILIVEIHLCVVGATIDVLEYVEEVMVGVIPMDRTGA